MNIFTAITLNTQCLVLDSGEMSSSHAFLPAVKQRKSRFLTAFSSPVSKKTLCCPVPTSIYMSIMCIIQLEFDRCLTLNLLLACIYAYFCSGQQQQQGISWGIHATQTMHAYTNSCNNRGIVRVQFSMSGSCYIHIHTRIVRNYSSIPNE